MVGVFRRTFTVEYGDAANEVIQRLIDNQGCSFSDGQSRYRYLIEDLGDFPCLVVPPQKRASRHIRITLLLLTNDENTASVLQLRIIKPSAMIQCSGEGHAVTTGISSWRYIPAVNEMKP